MSEQIEKYKVKWTTKFKKDYKQANMDKTNSNVVGY